MHKIFKITYTFFYTMKGLLILQMISGSRGLHFAFLVSRSGWQQWLTVKKVIDLPVPSWDEQKSPWPGII
jgi:hypothetical protein